MKKIIFTILCFFVFEGLCNAQVTTFDRNYLENYGVNKKWDINDTNKNNVLNTHAVDASEKVYDFSDIFTPYEEQLLKKSAKEFYDITGFELVILTESFYNQDDDDNGDYAQDFYDYNDFGLNDKYYSGVIILRNTYPGLPYYGVYSFGEAQFYYPAEYSDNRLNHTLDNVYYDMTSKNYLYAMDTIISDLTYYYKQGKEQGMEDYILDDNGVLVFNGTYKPPILIALITSIIVTWIYISTNVKKNKTVYNPIYANEYISREGIKITNRSDVLYDSRTTQTLISHSSGFGSSSGGGGRSYSSSRGSSGGGRSGGGRRG